MKKCKRIRLIFVSLAFVLMGTAAQPQSLIQANPTPEMQEEALWKVERLENELSLGAKQADLMERKFIEYAIKRQKLLQMEMTPEQRLKELATLKFLETTDMRDILTKPQYDRYVEILEEEAEEVPPQQ